MHAMQTPWSRASPAAAYAPPHNAHNSPQSWARGSFHGLSKSHLSVPAVGRFHTHTPTCACSCTKATSPCEDKEGSSASTAEPHGKPALPILGTRALLTLQCGGEHGMRTGIAAHCPLHTKTVLLSSANPCRNNPCTSARSAVVTCTHSMCQVNHCWRTRFRLQERKTDSQLPRPAAQMPWWLGTKPSTAKPLPCPHPGMHIQFAAPKQAHSGTHPSICPTMPRHTDVLPLYCSLQRTKLPHAGMAAGPGASGAGWACVFATATEPASTRCHQRRLTHTLLAMTGGPAPS